MSVSRFNSFNIGRAEGAAYNNCDHSYRTLTSHEECRGEKNQDRYWHSGRGKGKLAIFPYRNDDKELDCKSKEEKEIELEEGNVNLAMYQYSVKLPNG